MNEKIYKILNEFKIYDGIYKCELVDAAIELKDEITPYLIEILENVLYDPEKYIEFDDRYDHIYSLMLLGHFKESNGKRIKGYIWP